MLKELPDTAPMDPKRIAEVVSAAVDKTPKPESFIKMSEVPTDITSATEGKVEVKSDKGFMVTGDTPDSEEEE